MLKDRHLQTLPSPPLGCVNVGCTHLFYMYTCSLCLFTCSAVVLFESHDVHLTSYSVYVLCSTSYVETMSVLMHNKLLLANCFGVHFNKKNSPYAAFTCVFVHVCPCEHACMCVALLAIVQLIYNTNRSCSKWRRAGSLE